jgi:hypothetical protein
MRLTSTRSLRGEIFISCSILIALRRGRLLWRTEECGRHELPLARQCGPSPRRGVPSSRHTSDGRFTSSRNRLHFADLSLLSPITGTSQASGISAQWRPADSAYATGVPNLWWRRGPYVPIRASEGTRRRDLVHQPCARSHSAWIGKAGDGSSCGRPEARIPASRLSELPVPFKTPDWSRCRPGVWHHDCTPAWTRTPAVGGPRFMKGV